MLVFGGYNGTFLNDVHELTFNASGDGASWRRVETCGTPPSPRDGHSAVLAPDKATLLIFGGFDGTHQLNDLYALDTRTHTWKALHVESECEPTDPACEEVDVDKPTANDSDDSDDSDGSDDSEGEPIVAALSDFEGTGEAGAEDAAPAARYMHSAVACQDGMLVFGGYLAGGAFACDLWMLHVDGGDERAGADGTSAGEIGRVRWSRVRPRGQGPGGLFGHAAALDRSGRLWISGGFGGSSFSSRLHVLDAERKRWTLVEARGSTPSPRHKHTMVATADDRLLLFGGNDFGPTRGFFELDASAALATAQRHAVRGVARAASVQVVVHALQLLALLVTIVSTWLRQLGYIGVVHVSHSNSAAARCVCACMRACTCSHARGHAPAHPCARARDQVKFVKLLNLAAAAMVITERMAPPPGGFIARARRRPRRSTTGDRVAFTRSSLSSATDAAAGIAAASLAFLIGSAGHGRFVPGKG